MARKRERGVPLPKGVHRVHNKATGRTYYYAWRGKGAPRLPDPEADPLGFAAAVKSLKGAPEREQGTVDGLIQAYIDSREFAEKRPATRKSYMKHLRVIRETFGRFAAVDIQPAHVRELRNSLDDRPVWANRMVTMMRTVWAWGIEHNWPIGNPAKDVRMLTVKTHGHKPWPDWAWDVAEHLRPELRRAVMLGRYTGQRLSDVLAMRLSDIDGGVLRITQSKTGKAVVIPVHARLREEIDAARADGRIYLVSRPDGSPFTPDAFSGAWSLEMRKEPQGKIRQAGLTFHGLRKSAVAELARAGCDPVRIAAITRHSLPEVERYLGEWSLLELARQAMDRWEAQ